MRIICLLPALCLLLSVSSAAAEWYRKSPDAVYKPDEEDQKLLRDVLGRKVD